MKKLAQTVGLSRLKEVVSEYADSTPGKLLITSLKPKEKDEYISNMYSQENYIIVNLDRVLADQSAKIRSETNLRLPDSIIVATSLKEKVSFLISNDEKFDRAEVFIKVCTSEDFCKNSLSSN